MTILNLSTQYFTPTTGQTITVLPADNHIAVIIEPAGALLALTVALPAMQNGQIVRFVSTAAITALTLTSGVSIVQGITTLLGGTSAVYIYYAATNKMYRI